VPPRFHVAAALAARIELDLPAGAARHAQVLRLQPGSALTLFDGRGGEWAAVVLAMGRADVRVRVDRFVDVDRELALRVTLALGMPANERMDALVEKATELGVDVIQPLHCSRSVLRLAGERALKKVAHWQAVAQAASEQCGRTRLPVIAPVCALPDWLAALPGPIDTTTVRLLLSAPGADEAHLTQHDERGASDDRFLASAADGTAPVHGQRLPAPGQPRSLLSLSGPEGGLTDDEIRTAQHYRFQPVSLGPRILRADTAPLALLARLGGSVAAIRPHQGSR
jgi:16S rRNA (uracil1498-N3)-methyltransferase